jgi:hypothetical protein
MTLDFVEEFFRNRACTTFFPNSCSNSSNTTLASATQDSRPDTGVDQKPTFSQPEVDLSIPLTLTRAVTRPKKRKAKRGFTIYIDADAVDIPMGPEAQRPKRGPLEDRIDSANATPASSPRSPDATFPRSPDDADKENWDPNPRVTPSPTPAAFPHNPQARNGPPPPSPSPRARIIRPTRMAAPSPPRSMVLYNLLGLTDWKVSKKAIMSAWRQTAREVHPDRAAVQDREAATMLMQKLNAAVEVLSDRTRRRQYHVDGVLPWAE